MNSTAYLGKCKTKGCKHASYGTYDALLANTDRATAKPLDRSAPWHYGNDGPCAICPDHGVYYLRTVKGRLVPDHKCDARCTTATGPACDCSCGGANHGVGHAH